MTNYDSSTEATRETGSSWSVRQHPNASSPYLTVVIPTYNEEHRLEESLERVTAYLSSRPYHWELVISDDGSEDRTLLIAHTFAEQWPQIRVLPSDENRGKGDAVRRGVLAARGAYTLFTDADLSTPIEEVESFLPLLQSESDVVIGSRAMPESRIVEPQPWHRRLGGYIVHRLIHYFVLYSVHDSQCGFKAFRTTAARHIFSLLTIERFAFDVEVLLLAEELGYRTTEVGVTWADAPGTRLSPLRDSIRMLHDMYRIRKSVRERLDDDIETVPLKDERSISLIALQRANGSPDLPIEDAIDRAKRSADTMLLSERDDTTLLATFGVTPKEAEQVAHRLVTTASKTLAGQGSSSAVTVDVQPLPLATPMPWLVDRAAPPETLGVPSERLQYNNTLLKKLSLEEQQREADRRVFEKRYETWKRRRRSLRLLITANIAGLAFWLSWLLDFGNAATLPLYSLLVAAECFNLLQVLGYWYTVWNEPAPQRLRARVSGRIDVFITTYNEPVDLVEKTARAAVAMPYPHRTYVLDDGNRPEMGEMARRVGAHWITRPDNRGAKAGNINHALSVTDGDFFVVFDADHVPHPNFLDRMMPYMADTRAAFAQAPQYYVNRHKTYLTEGAMDQQELFFGPICKGKDGLGAVFCCGTNMVIRRSAIDSIGGFREDSITEDAVTSLDLHERGWTSRYVGERLADGLAPEDLSAYISQQRRWARGNIEMLFKSDLFVRRMALSLRLQYAWSAMYYLTSLTTVLYLALPCLFLLFGVQTVSAKSTDFIAHFLPYIFTTIFILARSAEGRLRFRAIQLSYGLFPVFIGAFYSILTGRKVGFAVTPKEGRIQSFYHLVIPQLTAIGISFLAILVGFAHYSGAATVTNSCWALFNVVMLSGIIRAAAPQRPKEHRSTGPTIVAAFDDMRQLPSHPDYISARW
jgi:cellulose synthase (UDP-forming)